MIVLAPYGCEGCGFKACQGLCVNTLDMSWGLNDSTCTLWSEGCRFKPCQGLCVNTLDISLGLNDSACILWL